MPIEVTFARDRPLTTQVEHSDCAHLSGVRDADRHTELLLDRWIRRGRLHSSEFDWRRLPRIAGRQRRRGRGRGGIFGVVWKELRRHVFSDELIAGPVVGPGAIDIRLHQGAARQLAFLNATMHVGDGGFEKMKPKRLRGFLLLCVYAVAPDHNETQDNYGADDSREGHAASSILMVPYTPTVATG